MPYIQCQALTRKGEPCLNGAMAHSRYCGPHEDYDPHQPPQQREQCHAHTLKNVRCRIPADPDSKYCSTHNDQRSAFRQTNNLPDQLDLDL